MVCFRNTFKGNQLKNRRTDRMQDTKHEMEILTITVKETKTHFKTTTLKVAFTTEKMASTTTIVAKGLNISEITCSPQPVIHLSPVEEETNRCRKHKKNQNREKANVGYQ